MLKSLTIVLILLGETWPSDQFIKNIHQAEPSKPMPNLENCFCKLNGDVDDCNCKIDYIDKFNNYQIHPRISSLVQSNYFRFIKINLKKICQFWPDDARCSLKDCHVQVCSEVSKYLLILNKKFSNCFNYSFSFSYLLFSFFVNRKTCRSTLKSTSKNKPKRTRYVREREREKKIFYFGFSVFGFIFVVDF